MALLEVVEFGVMHGAVMSLTTGMKIIAFYVDIHAGARVRTSRTIHRRIRAARVTAVNRAIAVTCAYRSTDYATKMAIIIRDIAAAFLIVVKLGINPVTITRLAASVKIITANVNVAAALPIGSCRAVGVLVIGSVIATGTIASNRACSVRCGGNAAQLSVVIHDVTLALAIVVKLGITPGAVTGLAFCV